MNQTALACGVEAVEDKAYFEEGVRKKVETRGMGKRRAQETWFLFSRMQRRNLFSQDIREVDANELFQALKENQYLCQTLECTTNRSVSENYNWYKRRDGDAFDF